MLTEWMHGWVSEWLREWSLDATCQLVGRFYEAFPQAFQCLHSSTCQRTRAFEIHVPRVNTVTFYSLKLTRSSISSLHLVVLAKPSLRFHSCDWPLLWSTVLDAEIIYCDYSDFAFGGRKYVLNRKACQWSHVRDHGYSESVASNTVYIVKR